MKTRMVVSVIIEKDDTLLFGKKKPGVGPYPDTWHLIGGGANDDESLEEAIVREIHEEAGIEVKIIESLGFDEDHEPNKHGEMTHYIFFVFRAKYVSGEPKADDDIVELRWIPKSDLSRLALNRPTVRLFQKNGFL